MLGGSLSFDGTARGAGTLDALGLDALASARDMSFPGWRELLPDYLTRLDAGTGGFAIAGERPGPTLARGHCSISARRAWSPRLTDGPSAKFEQISGALDPDARGRSMDVARPARARAHRGRIAIRIRSST